MKFVLLALSLFVLVAASELPGEGGQQPSVQRHQDKQRSPDDLRGTELLPLIVKTLPPPVDEEKARKDDAKEDRKESSDRWLVRLTALLALATTILAVYTLRLAAATDKLVVGAEKTAERQLRAYIGIDNAVFEKATHSATTGATDSMSGFIKLEIKNYGATPAFNLIAKTGFKIGTDAEGIGVIPLTDGAENYPKVSIPPGKLFTLSVRAFDERISIEKWRRFSEKEQRAYLFGRLDYEDSFGQPRFVTFQLKGQFGRMASLSYCADGNDSN
jgi:hypothetical protein